MSASLSQLQESERQGLDKDPSGRHQDPGGIQRLPVTGSSLIGFQSTCMFSGCHTCIHTYISICYDNDNSQIEN